jgi:hypothetical protein
MLLPAPRHGLEGGLTAPPAAAPAAAAAADATATMTTREGRFVAYQDATSFAERARLGRRARARFPDRAPVIVQRGHDNRAHPAVDAIGGATSSVFRPQKYLVPLDTTLHALMFTHRRKMRLGPCRALFFFVRKDGAQRLVHGGLSVRELYATDAEADGLLYLEYAFENAFG